MSSGAHRSDDVELRRLLPECSLTTVGELVSSLDLIGKATAERPYIVVNFIATVDGRSAFQGRSGGLSDAGDRAMFHGLRERVDAVFAGTGTLQTERYRRLVLDPERRSRRAAAGLRPEPLAVVISRSGTIPTDIPLFADPEARVVVFTAAEFDALAFAAEVDVVRLDRGQLTLTAMMRRLRNDYDVRALLCEGGPTIFSALLQEELVDELFLTLAPKLAGGGTGPLVTSGPELTGLKDLELVWACEANGELFLRYTLP
jgi:5-amino-6-(5-phosphoribosylamino)uracil reductase